MFSHPASLQGLFRRPKNLCAFPVLIPPGFSSRPSSPTYSPLENSQCSFLGPPFLQYQTENIKANNSRPCSGSSDPFPNWTCLWPPPPRLARLNSSHPSPGPFPAQSFLPRYLSHKPAHTVTAASLKSPLQTRVLPKPMVSSILHRFPSRDGGAVAAAPKNKHGKRN